MKTDEALELLDLAQVEDPEMGDDFREALFTVAAEVRALRQRHSEAAMTDLPLLREAVTKMTPGPWRNIGDTFVGLDNACMGFVCGGTDLQDMTIADINGLVALRNAAPALLDELEALKARACDEETHESIFEDGWKAARRTKPAEYQETEHELRHSAYLAWAEKESTYD